MKKTLVLTLMSIATIAASAQVTVEGSKFFDNMSLTVKGGAASPLTGGDFLKNARGEFGLELRKQITPIFGIGVEGELGVNTSSWKNFAVRKSSNVFDSQYVGTYGAVNLMNLFAGYAGSPRLFEIEAVAGAGWGHTYYPVSEGNDHNFFATKAGANLNFNLGSSKAVTLSLMPRVGWDMTDVKVEKTSCAYDARKAVFELSAAVTYHFKNSNGTHSFVIQNPYDAEEVELLNATVNGLRAEVAGLNNALADVNAQCADLQNQLTECQNRPVQTVTQTVKETTNTLNSVRYIFYKIGSSVITADQQPNVEMIAAYLKNHPKSKVVIKGYASPDGPLEVNIRLANQRANAVKDALMSKYRIAADRIQAEGEGIGNMFSEESWNRVAICTIED